MTLNHWVLGSNPSAPTIFSLGNRMVSTPAQKSAAACSIKLIHIGEKPRRESPRWRCCVAWRVFCPCRRKIVALAGAGASRGPLAGQCARCRCAANRDRRGGGFSPCDSQGVRTGAGSMRDDGATSEAGSGLLWLRRCSRNASPR